MDFTSQVNSITQSSWMQDNTERAVEEESPHILISTASAAIANQSSKKSFDFWAEKISKSDNPK